MTRIPRSSRKDGSTVEADLQEAHSVADFYNPRSHSVDPGAESRPRVEIVSPRVSEHVVNGLIRSPGWRKQEDVQNRLCPAT